MLGPVLGLAILATILNGLAAAAKFQLRKRRFAIDLILWFHATTGTHWSDFRLRIGSMASTMRFCNETRIGATIIVCHDDENELRQKLRYRVSSEVLLLLRSRWQLDFAVPVYRFTAKRSKLMAPYQRLTDMIKL